MPDSDIKKYSVTKNDEPEARASIVNFFINAMPTQSGLPAYPSSARDAYLRNSLYQPFHDFWAGAVGIAITKFVSLGFTITSNQPRIRSYFQEMLLDWQIEYSSQFIQDYTTTDNGAFIEIVRASKSAGSRILGLIHLDSLRVTRTGNADIPAIYRDTDGVEHELQAHQIMMFADMPSPSVTHHGIGLCAASRAWGQIVKLESIERYIYDKTSGKRSLGLEILKGVADKDIRSALDSAKEMRESQSVMGKAYTYMGATVMAILNDTPLEHVSIPFASLPDGFDRKQELDIALLAYANAIGLDPQDLQPLTGQSLGTGAQSVVLHEKQKGKGQAALRLQMTHQFNLFLLPDSAVFAFTENDIRDQQQQAQVESTRTTTNVQRVQAGIITAPQAAQILADNGDLPKEFVQPDTTPTETVSDEDKPSQEDAVVEEQPASEQPQPEPATQTQKELHLQFADALKRFNEAMEHA